MLKDMRYVVGIAALALAVGVAPRASAQQDNAQTAQPQAGQSGDAKDSNAAPGSAGAIRGGYDQNSNRGNRDARNMDSSMNGSSMMNAMNRPTDWSHRYRLTPLEHKRLRALGFNDSEVFAVANAAEACNMPLDAPSFDNPALMVMRGRSFGQIAEEVGIPYSTLEGRRPEWQTAEWQQASREGWYSFRPGMTSGSGMGGSNMSGSSMSEHHGAGTSGQNSTGTSDQNNSGQNNSTGNPDQK